MVLNNFWEWFRIVCKNTFYNNDGTNNCYGARTSMKAIDWTSEGTQLPYLFGYNNYPSFISSSANQSYIEQGLRPTNIVSMRVGTGETAVDAYDYKLDTDVTSSFSNIGFSCNPAVSADGKVTFTVVWNGTNASGSDITIKEIGLIHQFALGALNAYSYNSLRNNAPLRNVMIARHILETPVTIAAGDTGSVNVNLTLF